MTESISREGAVLLALARREQSLLAGALASLFTDPVLDAKISRALGYPDWPLPLTLLPEIAPGLALLTPQLAAYLAFAAEASGRAAALIAARGWPRESGRDVADAAWLLLQHADPLNEEREALVPLVADAVNQGHADPRHLALLTDRVRAVRGDGQHYGTFRLIRDERPVLLYPLGHDESQVDHARRAIGLATLAEDAQFAYSPLIPYGATRTSPVNPWQRDAPATEQADTDVNADTDRFSDVPAPVPATTAGVYLGATLRHRNQMRRIRTELRTPLVSTSRWLDIDPFTRASCQFDAGVALNQLAARLCLTDVARSTMLIAFAGHRRSHGLGIEIGAALAHGIPIIIIGAPRCSFDMLPGVTIVSDVAEALATATATRYHLHGRASA